MVITTLAVILVVAFAIGWHDPNVKAIFNVLQDPALRPDADR